MGPVVPRWFFPKALLFLSPRQTSSQGPESPVWCCRSCPQGLTRPESVNRAPWPPSQAALPAPGQLEGPSQLEPATRLWLELPWPLPSLQCTQRSAPGFLSCPGLSELSSGFIFGRRCILSPYLLLAFREGAGPLGSAGDRALALASRVWASLGLQGRGAPKTPDPSDASKPAASVLLPPPSV